MSADRFSEALVRAEAVPIAQLVSRFVRLNKNGFALCPFHTERTPSFHVDSRRNIFKCFGCGIGGGPIQFIQRMRDCDRASAVQELAGGISRSGGSSPPRLSAGISGNGVAAPASSNGKVFHSARLIHELWDGADQPRLAELYLWARGLALRPKPLMPALRGHGAVYCAELKATKPAVLVAVTTLNDELVALQRVWVDEKINLHDFRVPDKGTRTVGLKVGKKTLGNGAPLGGAAVRLFDAGRTLGLAEGFETAIAAKLLFHMPVWATIGAYRLGSIELPDCVESVVIVGDTGPAGESMAKVAEQTYRQKGYRTEAIFPKAPYSDFNDQLLAE